MKKIKKIYLQLPKQHKVIISSFSILLMLFLLVPSEKATASRQNNEGGLEVGKRYQVSLPQDEAPTNNTTDPKSLDGSVSKNTSDVVDNKKFDEKDIAWQVTKVRSGDSLAKIFKRLGYSAKTTHNVINAQGQHSKLLTKLNVNDKIFIASNEKKQLTALKYPISKTETLYVHLSPSGYESYKDTKTVEIREAFTHGVIQSNFWSSALSAGMENKQIIALANIFGWDIDFASDIRKGDSFHVIYEKRYIDGDYIGTGKILAAEFINQNETFQAIRYSDDNFYSPDGKSMRKAFLRAPVNFKYISSNFKKKRFHPVQKRWKAHRGTDYAAKTGTPVVSAGNGKVTHSTYNKYNGHYVFIQHGNGIVTKYLHFSKRKVKRGEKVKQGQVIGYVGATGLAAGPHLHYEFLLNGVHRNPRTVKLPDAKPINRKYKADFQRLAQQRIQELEGSKHVLLAMQTPLNTSRMD